MKKNLINENQDSKVFVNRLREFRIIPRISQWKLALDSGVKQSRISLIENFLVKPTEFEKNRLAQALKHSTKEIFPNDYNDGNGRTDHN